MKKLFVLLMAAGFCLAGKGIEPSSWVVTDEGRMEVKSIDFVFSKARIVLENGEKIKIPIKELNSYSIQGQVFDKLPLYKNGKPTGRLVFMELIKSRGDLNLYQYSFWDTESVFPYGNVKNAFVYKGDKLHLALNEKTLPSVCMFFGVEAVIE